MSMLRRRRRRAIERMSIVLGSLLALAGAFKPQLAVVFGLYWLCRRRWRAALTAIDRAMPGSALLSM